MILITIVVSIIYYYTIINPPNKTDNYTETVKNRKDSKLDNLNKLYKLFKIDNKLLSKQEKVYLLEHLVKPIGRYYDNDVVDRYLTYIQNNKNNLDRVLQMKIKFPEVFKFDIKDGYYYNPISKHYSSSKRITDETIEELRKETKNEKERKRKKELIDLLGIYSMAKENINLVNKDKLMKLDRHLILNENLFSREKVGFKTIEEKLNFPDNIFHFNINGRYYDPKSGMKTTYHMVLPKAVYEKYN
jgi:hypothetical protein